MTFPVVNYPMSQTTNIGSGMIIRCPEPTDGWQVHSLIEHCKPLDSNSIYCNLLQCTHFADTCAIAEDNEGILAWVSAYVEANKPDTLFIWQIAVAERARGQGLGKQLLHTLWTRPLIRELGFLETTITESNAASWKLFQSFARELKAPIETARFFDEKMHFHGLHPSEILLRIGPVQSL